MAALPSIRSLRTGPFLAVLGLLVLVALMGGASRADVYSLMILRPVAAILLGLGLLSLTYDTVLKFRFLFGLMAASIILVMIQLIPLPPAIWTLFPGRELVTRIDTLAGIGQPWRPITLTPFETWNAFYSLIVPTAALVLLAQLSREHRYGVLPLLIVIGIVSGVLGIMQVIGPASGPLYFYRVTNFTSAVGLFANRNHQAVLLACLFPMLAVFARLLRENASVGEARMRGWLALGVGALLVPLLLVTGSRLGLVIGAIGLLSALLLYATGLNAERAPNSARKKRAKWPYLAGGAAIVGLVAVTTVFSRAVAIDRLFDIGDDESRIPLWSTTMQLTDQFFPVGTGFGSFIPVYQIAESHGVLDTTYTNHAHNDFLEVALTGGLLGVLILLLAAVGWVLASWRAFSTPSSEGRVVQFARLGSILILILGVASLTDYPLRTPFLACWGVVAAVWLAGIYETRSFQAFSGRRTGASRAMGD